MRRRQLVIICAAHDASQRVLRGRDGAREAAEAPRRARRLHAPALALPRAAGREGRAAIGGVAVPLLRAPDDPARDRDNPRESLALLHGPPRGPVARRRPRPPRQRLAEQPRPARARDVRRRRGHAHALVRAEAERLALGEGLIRI